LVLTLKVTSLANLNQIIPAIFQTWLTIPILIADISDFTLGFLPLIKAYQTIWTKEKTLYCWFYSCTCCQIAREKRSRICRENFETAPDKGYSAVSKAYYYGCKLHLITSVRGVFASMDMSKASVHDVYYLTEIKYSNLSNCRLFGDKGYLAKEHQLDLFSSCNIRLETPKRSNQKNKEPFAYIFKMPRKRIETLFSQLCDQFMLKRNYAKTNLGISVRLLSKIIAVTVLQYFNFLNIKPLNRLKYALAA
jgi:hypothetical protein